MVERTLLLALVKRIRRRRRWIVAIGAGLRVVAVVGPAMALMVLLARRFGGVRFAALIPWAALFGLAGLAAIAWASRRMSLGSCARLIDGARVGVSANVDTSGGGIRGRERGHEHEGEHGGTKDDCVLAAVALVEAAAPPTPFLDALTIEAVARTRSIPARRVVPGPASRTLAFAMAGMGLLAVAGLAPVARSRAATNRALAGAARDAVAASAVAAVPRLTLPWTALDSEREDVRRANTAARDAADPELARLAAALHKLLGDLAGDGLEGTVAIARIEKLTDETRLAAKMSATAQAAADAARATLGAARGVGSDATALAAAVAEAARASSNDAAADAVVDAATRLASHGVTGRGTLGAAAESAAAAIGGGAAPSDDGAAGTSDNGTNHDKRRRRLGDEADSPTAGNGTQAAVGGATTPNQRRLEQLRRGLEQTATGCHGDPDACRSNAASAARALTELQRQGRTADARRRLAEAARQFLDRVRRSGGDGENREAMRRFAQSARGARRPGPAGTGAPALAESENPNGATDTPRAIVADEGRGEAEPEFDSPQSPESSQSQSPAQSWGAAGDEIAPTAGARGSNDATGSSGEGVGSGVAMATGSGIGSQPGGPVLGARRSRSGAGAGAPGGHDARARVDDDGAGPSRSSVIGGAAARGFASMPYRRVFSDYQAAVEENLDTSAVPPGRRYLVRRYFQLIRPRTPTSTTTTTAPTQPTTPTPTPLNTK